MIRYYFTVVCFIAVGFSVSAQSWNPFDIKNRNAEDARASYEMEIGKEGENVEEAETTVALEEVRTERESNRKPIDLSENPFEIIRFEEVETGGIEAEIVSPSERKGVFLFIVIVAVYLFTGILASLYRKFIEQLYRAILNDNYMKFFRRSVNDPIRQRLILFYALFIINGGLFVYLSLEHLGLGSSLDEPVVLLYSMLLLLGYFLFKHFAIWFVATFFPPEREAEQYNFSIAVFNAFLGILLLPINTIMLYGGAELAILGFYLGLLLWIFLLIVRQLKAMLSASYLWLNYVFHFFLYLCVVEIAPICILWKSIQFA